MQQTTENTETQRPTDTEVVLRGVSICPGIATGRLHLVDLELPESEDDIDPSEVKAEQKRYTRAVKDTKSRLHDHIAMVHGNPVPDAETILKAHQIMLEDESFHDKVRARIETDGKPAEWCLWQEASALISQFSTMRDPYFSARGEDIRDMAHNVISVLTGGTKASSFDVGGDDVLISRYLHSSDAILAHRTHGCAFASESRALVSHAAILLKGFGIPSVGGVADLTRHAREGDPIVVNGTEGVVVLRPSSERLKKYEPVQGGESPMADRAVARPCLTADGVEVHLHANIENPDQSKLVPAYGLDGIGLFRTEFLIPHEGQVPAEETQYEVYREVMSNVAGGPLVIRTFDVGGDKPMGLSDRCTGRNPSLGVRGIRRHLLDQSEELRTQLRAILRAAAGGSVGILVPMVTTVEDVREAKSHLEEVSDELSREKTDFPSDVSLGAMIETPAAAASVGDILQHVDFISVGTNDLLQYFMAADRDNERVVRYNDATSPAFLWLMKFVIEQARQADRLDDVTVCGEIASDMCVLPHLLRIGYRSFSISPVLAGAVYRACATFGSRG